MSGQNPYHLPLHLVINRNEQLHVLVGRLDLVIDRYYEERAVWDGELGRELCSIRLDLSFAAECSTLLLQHTNLLSDTHSESGSSDTRWATSPPSE